jgi:dihydroorotate dehydrogenase
LIYRLVFNLFFKRLNPEHAHDLVVFGLRLLSAVGMLRAGKKRSTQSVMGLPFENRFGMAAGFDKNGLMIRPLHALGFSHVEIGTVTARPQDGHEKPRLFRLPDNRALINRMGFNNDGAEVVAERLRRLRARHSRLPIIGVNLGKNKTTTPADAAADYRFSTELLAPLADYLVVNVSSPNTPGLRDLQQVDALRPILIAVRDSAGEKPVLVKIAPDLSDEDILAACDLVIELSLAGVVATNTTIRRDELQAEKHQAETGGLSGPVLLPRAFEVVGLVRSRLGKDRTVIGVGGVSTASDYQQMLKAGADLVQAYTGFVYGGPLWPRRVLS